MREHGGSFAKVGKIFGITRQAVEYAWRLLGYGDTPMQIAWAERRERILELATRGLPAPAIADALGATDQVVHRVASSAGIALAPVPTTTDRLRFEIEAVAARVDAGEITLTEAGHELGIAAHFVRPFVKIDILHRKREFRAFDGESRSKSERTSDLVDQGIHPVEAARQLGISERTIYQWRNQRGLPPSIGARRPPGPRRARSA